MEFIKREFAKTAVEKAIHNLMASSTEKIIKEKNLHPIITPVAEPLDFADPLRQSDSAASDKPFSFKLKIEQAPEFTPKDYKKIKVVKKIKKITDKEINEVIKNLQDRQSTLEDAGPVAAEAHHFIIADYEGTVDGKKMDKPAENQIIDLSHQSLPEGFAKGLLGLKAGESKTIETKIADKPAKFDVKIKAIKKKVSPKIDDEFAKDLGNENVGQMKEKIKGELVKAEEEKARQEMENQIVESLLASNEFPVPETLVNDEIEHMLERTKQYLVGNHNFNEEEFKKSIPAMKDKYKKDADKTVRVSYLLSRIAKDENIAVSPEEIDRKIEEISAGDKKVAENYGRYREYLTLQIKEKKLFDLLLSNAKIKEEQVK
jgi:trigger factor